MVKVSAHPDLHKLRSETARHEAALHALRNVAMGPPPGVILTGEAVALALAAVSRACGRDEVDPHGIQMSRGGVYPYDPESYMIHVHTLAAVTVEEARAVAEGIAKQAGVALDWGDVIRAERRIVEGLRLAIEVIETGVGGPVLAELQRDARNDAPHGATVAGLDARQEAALAVFLAGGGDTAAAREAHVDRSTVFRWRRYDADFRAEMNRRQNIRRESMDARIEDLLPKALAAVEAALQGEDLALRTRAALALLAGRGFLTGERPPRLEEDADNLKAERLAEAADPPPFLRHVVALKGADVLDAHDGIYRVLNAPPEALAALYAAPPVSEAAGAVEKPAPPRVEELPVPVRTSTLAELLGPTNGNGAAHPVNGTNGNGAHGSNGAATS